MGSKKANIPAGFSKREWRDFKKNIKGMACGYEGDRARRFGDILAGAARGIADASPSEYAAMQTLKKVQESVRNAIPSWQALGKSGGGIDANAAIFLKGNLHAQFEKAEAVIHEIFRTRSGVQKVMSEVETSDHEKPEEESIDEPDMIYVNKVGGSFAKVAESEQIHLYVVPGEYDEWTPDKCVDPMGKARAALRQPRMEMSNIGGKTSYEPAAFWMLDRVIGRIGESHEIILAAIEGEGRNRKYLLAVVPKSK
jgi:hypothetical protein